MSKNITKTIKDDDFLGRAIFSKKYFKKNIRPDVFLERKGHPISTDRFGFCDLKKLVSIQKTNAEIRSTKEHKRSFYGWAKIKVEEVRQNGRTVKATPSKDNPYHADISLPKSITKDDEKQHKRDDERQHEKVHAQELASHAEPFPSL